jgi:phosphoglycolate phosphatase
MKAVLFDLDGTLLDTIEDLADSMNAVLRGLGLPEHGVAAYNRFVGDGVENLVRRALPADRTGEEDVRRGVAAMREEYGNRWDAKSRAYAGIPELLDGLEAREVPLTVLSNKPDGLTVLCVEKLLPRWRFAAVRGAREGVPKKPDPTAALEIAAELAVAPADFLYVGDTDTDMRTAVAAGMRPVGALWGFRDAEELIACGAETLIARPPDLLDLL